MFQTLDNQDRELKKKARKDKKKNKLEDFEKFLAQKNGLVSNKENKEPGS